MNLRQRYKKSKKLKVELFLSLGFIYIFFMILTLYFDYSRITQDFLEEQNIKNKNISKITYTLLKTLENDTYNKIKILHNNKSVTEAFAKKDRKKLYKLVSKYYKRQTLLNKYLKIMTFRESDGTAFLRVHKPEMFGDKLNKIRKIIVDTNKLQKTQYGFEVGKLGMTYRIVVPIYHQGKHIGLVELGIEPEYFIDKLVASFDILHALLVQKDTLSASLDKEKFIREKDDYVMVRGDEFFQKYLDQIDLKNRGDFIQFKDNYYLVEKNLNLFDHTGNITAKLLFASKVNNFNRRDSALLQSAFVTSVLFLLLFLVVNYIINKFIDIQQKQIEIINKQSKKLEVIFNGASSIIILTDGRKLIEANNEFLLFFDQYKNIDEFKKEYDCICDKFVPFEVEGYINGKVIDGMPWTDYIIKYSDKSHKVVMLKEDKLHHFNIKVKGIKFMNEILQVVDLSDITKEKEQEAIILQQSKLASMGEMIGNIAHQWRQPLSIISTGATGIQLKKEYDMLTDEYLDEICNMINNNAQYLSKTIDDFKNFIRGDRVKTEFKLEDEINSLLTLLEGTIKNNHIKVILDLENDLYLDGYESELTQALINIFNNSKDVLKEIETEDRFFFISTKKVDDKVEIVLKDNGGGISEDVISKVFEPYFTTKHQTQGTGLGLHMTYNLIVDGMDGNIVMNNINYEYNNKNYKGVEIVITL